MSEPFAFILWCKKPCREQGRPYRHKRLASWKIPWPSQKQVRCVLAGQALWQASSRHGRPWDGQVKPWRSYTVQAVHAYRTGHLTSKTDVDNIRGWQCSAASMVSLRPWSVGEVPSRHTGCRQYHADKVGCRDITEVKVGCTVRIKSQELTAMGSYNLTLDVKGSYRPIWLRIVQGQVSSIRILLAAKWTTKRKLYLESYSRTAL